MPHCQYILVMHHFSAQPSLNKRWLEQTMAASKYLIWLKHGCLFHKGQTAPLHRAEGAGKSCWRLQDSDTSFTTNQRSTEIKPAICGTTQQEPRESEQHMHGQGWSRSRSTRRLKKDQILLLFFKRTEGILLRYWSVLKQKFCLKSSFAERK